MPIRQFVLMLLALAGVASPAVSQPLPHPILFVTQVPIRIDFGVIGSTFANHTAGMREAGRGGDLYIRYPNGTLRNLTAEAGFGVASGLQGANAIAVRDPALHWSGAKAVFSMVVGGQSTQGSVGTYRWQLYEVTGLGSGQTASITRVATQPAIYNNIAPTYASDGSLIFTSDRPRDGRAHLYPQHDEYESSATVSGLWKLDAATGALSLIEHAPSGAFDPMVDSYGRVVFTRWDHLVQDQQNEDAYNDACQITNPNPYQTFNYASEEPGGITADRSEVFPELHDGHCRNNHGFNDHGFKHFFPWMINQDGTGEETINHIGRQELLIYFTRSMNGDPNIVDFARDNANVIENMFQITEDPTVPGRYYGIDAPEFGTAAAGQLIRLDAPPTRNPTQMHMQYLTPRSTFGFTPAADHSGHYRNPLVLSDGRIVVAHTNAQGLIYADNYDFRLKRLDSNGNGFLAPVETLTGSAGIAKNLHYWVGDDRVDYNGPLWELSPVEVRARTAPGSTTWALETPERNAFELEGVSEAAFRNYLRAQNLAVVVMRNVTTRDRDDKQQPYNLRVPGGAQTIGATGAVYDIAHMQFFQADQIRGHGPSTNPVPGRRVLAQPLHDPRVTPLNPANPTGPAGATSIAADGSVALFVPTRRAMVWQSTDPTGRPVVRERYWVTFQPGEIRACGGCHGVNATNQAGQAAANNTATAFRELLARWRVGPGNGDAVFVSGFED